MIVIGSLSILAFGCSKPQQPDSTILQGRWISQEVGTSNLASVVFQGTNLQYRGGSTNEWFNATFSTREDKKPKQLVAAIISSSHTGDVGKTSHAIYQMQDGAFKISVYGPGNSNMPPRFDAPGTLTSVFKRP